jgi:hypothetical protein
LMGIARVFLGSDKARSAFPGPRPDVLGHPHRWALALLGSRVDSSSLSAAESAPR